MTKRFRQSELPLSLHLAFILSAKVLGIFLLWFFFFSPSHRPDAESEATGRAILERQTAVPSPAPISAEVPHDHS